VKRPTHRYAIMPSALPTLAEEVSAYVAGYAVASAGGSEWLHEELAVDTLRSRWLLHYEVQGMYARFDDERFNGVDFEVSQEDL
jgi:hypothetical protein